MMKILNKQNIEIKREQDVIFFRQRLREIATKLKMTTLSQTKLITAASEIVRNMLLYAKGGDSLIEVISVNNRIGLKITFTDQGPGIQDINQAMKSGFSTGKSLGLGLPGAKRLVNEFEIHSTPGKGTTVQIVRWLNAI